MRRRLPKIAYSVYSASFLHWIKIFINHYTNQPHPFVLFYCQVIEFIAFKAQTGKNLP